MKISQTVYRVPKANNLIRSSSDRRLTQALNVAAFLLSKEVIWLCRTNAYPVPRQLPTDAIGLERVEEPQVLHIDQENLAEASVAPATRE